MQFNDKQQYKKLKHFSWLENNNYRNSNIFPNSYWNMLAEILDSIFLWIRVVVIFQSTTMF